MPSLYHSPQHRLIQGIRGWRKVSNLTIFAGKEILPRCFDGFQNTCSLVEYLGQRTSLMLSFSGRGKISAWNTWDRFSEVTPALKAPSTLPYLQMIDGVFPFLELKMIACKFPFSILRPVISTSCIFLTLIFSFQTGSHDSRPEVHMKIMKRSLLSPICPEICTSSELSSEQRTCINCYNM